METVYIQGDRFSDLVVDLSRALQASGATVLEEKQPGAANLQILEQNFTRRVLSVGSDGKAREYALDYVVRFKSTDAAGGELLPEQSIRIERDFLDDGSGGLGSFEEETVFRQEMVRDAVQSILRRLQAKAP